MVFSSYLSWVRFVLKKFVQYSYYSAGTARMFNKVFVVIAGVYELKEVSGVLTCEVIELMHYVSLVLYMPWL